MSEYDGVDVQHPSIVTAIKNLAAQGKSTAQIMKVVGMPAEVVKSVAREVKHK
jgi:hypothetical protein